MNLRNFGARLAVLLGACAIALQTLWPLAGASAAPRAPTLELCAPESGSPAQQAPAEGHSLCALCLVGCERAAAAPNAKAEAAQPPHRSSEGAALARAAPREPQLHGAPRTRAPPARA